MKSYAKFLLLSVAVFSNQTYAAISDNASFQAPLAPNSLLLDISSGDDYILVVGERGHVLSSTNGSEWQQQSVPETATLTAVEVRSDHAWAVGHDGTIIHSSDGGQHWETQLFRPELEKPLLDVMFFNTRHGIAIGAYGLFFRTIDGGENWIKEYHPEFLSPDDQAYLEELKQEDESLYQQELGSILPHLNRVNQVGDSLYLAGEMGLLAQSQDQGKTWERLEIDYYGSFFDVKQDYKGDVLAAGLRGNVFVLNQETGRWSPVKNKSQSSFNSIINTGPGSTLIVGNNGRMLSLSERESKFIQTPQGKAIINGVMFNNSLILVTEQGVVTLNKE